MLARADSLPEHRVYRDTGCEVAPACLECPLPTCRYDVPGGARAMLLRERDAQVVALRDHGFTARRIAEVVGISKRSVHRILAEAHRGPAA